MCLHGAVARNSTDSDKCTKQVDIKHSLQMGQVQRELANICFETWVLKGGSRIVLGMQSETSANAEGVL